MKILISFVLGLVSAAIWAQSDMLRLTTLTEDLMMSQDADHRQACYDEIPEVLTGILAAPGSFHIAFDSVRRMSVVYPPDSSFRIFTGQHYIDENHYRYYGIIQLASDEQHPVILRDATAEVYDPRAHVGMAADWLGALYYKVHSFEREGRRHYLLFGFNSYQLYENRKVAEVLTFVDGNVHFGAPVFLDEQGQGQHRLLVQYAADVSVKLNYDDQLDLVIFDHLIPMASPYDAKKIAMVPDGSYAGYRLDKNEGHWTYVDKVFHQTLATPPREHPVLDGENHDLFGRKKN